MRKVLILALLLQASAIAPAWAENCGNPCDEGRVWTDKEGGKCIKPPPATS
jgi:hypothetical protein